MGVVRVRATPPHPSPWSSICVRRLFVGYYFSIFIWECFPCVCFHSECVEVDPLAVIRPANGRWRLFPVLRGGDWHSFFFFSASNTVEHTKRVIRVVAGACQFFTRAGCSSNLLPSPYMTFSKTSGSFLARVLSVNFFLLTHIECPCQPP